MAKQERDLNRHAEEKMKSRTIILLVLAALCFYVIPSAYAAGFEFKPYGFVKGDMTYASHGVLTFGKAGIAGPQMADTANKHLLGFSSQTSRFGFRGWSTNEETGIEVGGKLEIDLFTGTGMDNSAKPRLRLAYAWFATHLFEVRVGQQWDLFSPNNPQMNSIASALYYAGNMGVRRGQFQFTFYVPEETTAPIISVALCEASKEVDGLGPDNFSGIPMIQGRASIELAKKYQVGAYAVHANYDPNQEVGNDEYTTFGFGADYNLRFHSLCAVRGEFNTGTNLANGNFITATGNGKKDDDRKNTGFWINAISKPWKYFNLSAGYGIDVNKTDKIATGGVEQNTMFYSDFIFPVVSGLSFEAEVGQILTQYKDAGDESSMTIGIGGKVEF
jgi:hypothetical protein